MEVAEVSTGGLQDEEVPPEFLSYSGLFEPKEIDDSGTFWDAALTDKPEISMASMGGFSRQSSPDVFTITGPPTRNGNTTVITDANFTSLIEEFYGGAEEHVVVKCANPSSTLRDTVDEERFPRQTRSPSTIAGSHPSRQSEKIPGPIEGNSIHMIDLAIARSQRDDSPEIPEKPKEWISRAERKALQRALEASLTEYGASLALPSTVSGSPVATSRWIPQTPSRNDSRNRRRMPNGTVCEDCKRSKAKCDPSHVSVNSDPRQ